VAAVATTGGRDFGTLVHQILEWVPLDDESPERAGRVRAMAEAGVLGGVSLGRLYPGDESLASGLVVGLWGYFLIAAVYDPDGGIKALWPIFGIANQLLASIALCLATTIILKMVLRPGTTEAAGKRPGPVLALVTVVPLVWLLTVTGTASVQKIWSEDPRIGFLAKARQIESDQLPKQEALLRDAYAAAAGKLGSPESEHLDKVLAATLSLRSQRTNQYLDAVVTGFFLALVVGIFLISVREWVLLLARKKAAEPRETPPTWLPDYAVAEAKPFKLFSFLALSLALLKELSGEAAVDRAQQHRSICAQALEVDLLGGGLKQQALSRGEAYVASAEQRFEGPNRCC